MLVLVAVLLPTAIATDSAGAQARPEPLLVAAHQWRPVDDPATTPHPEVASVMLPAAAPRQDENRPSFVAHVFGGALAGAVVGGLIGLHSTRNSTDDLYINPVMAGAVLGATTGAVAGVLVWGARMAGRHDPDGSEP